MPFSFPLEFSGSFTAENRCGMKKFVYLSIVLLLAQVAWGQSVQLRIVDSLTSEPLAGVTVRINTTPPTGVVSNTDGKAQLANLPAGAYNVTVSFVGYKTQLLTLHWPLTRPDSVVTLALASAEAALEQVTVTATRTNRRIEDLPIKVEVLGQEDMDEEAAVVPGNVGSILGDISIIHIQRTSLPTNNQGIRMQGLDPKYTQILRDGLPLYEGFSGNLGVLQIPPLDLRQVEIIKGSASTLYGGGAIGGLINLVSRRPGNDPELTVVANRSTLRENNLNVYGSRQYSQKIGVTLFAGYTNQPARDVNGDGFSDVPLIHQFTIHPRLFLSLNPANKLNVGYSFVTERRDGGYVSAVDQPETTGGLYVQTNRLQRHTVDATYDHPFSQDHTFTGRATISYYDRKQNDGGYRFDGRQLSGYIEATDYLQRGSHTMVAGLTLTTEQFRKGTTDSTRIADFTYTTLGAFVQDDYTLGKYVTVQGGLRLDHHNVYGTFFLPRLSILTKPGAHFTIRTSIGTGYKTPNVFANVVTATPNASVRYRYLQPLDPTVRPEHSLGLNMDIAYQGNLGEHLTVQLDQAFFYSFVRDPIVANALVNNPTTQPLTRLQNAAYQYRTLGTDTYLRLEYDALEFYLGYNHTDARRVQTRGATFVPFNPRDKFSLTVAYEIPDKWRMGIEASWVGNQYLYTDQRVPSYWFWAAALERLFGRWHVILNAENIFNVQQFKLTGPVVTGDNRNPSIAPLWTPQEGRIVNLALKYQLHSK